VVPIRSRKTWRVLLFFLVVVLAVRGGMAWLDQATLALMLLALWTVLALLALASALCFALGARVVNCEHLYAGLSAYLLAGIFFGVFYWDLERIWPGSLAVAGEGVPSPISLPVAIYHSFVTLTTLGYGDIVPRSEVGRGLAIMEAVAGQLCMSGPWSASRHAGGDGGGPVPDLLAEPNPGATRNRPAAR
jgi:Ion channel